MENHNVSHMFNDDFVIERTINIRYQFPLSRNILLIRSLIVGISIPSSTSLPISTLYSYCDMISLVNQSHACKLIRYHSTERAQSISIRHWDGQIPLLIQVPQPYTFRTLNATFITTHLRSSVWCHQSIHPV